MPSDALSETIKVRVPEPWKKELQAEADGENLELSDITRRALAEFLGRIRRKKKAPAHR